MQQEDPNLTTHQIAADMEADHGRLSSLIEEAQQAIADGEARRLEHCLLRLLGREQAHFDRENKVMRILRYPHYDEHKSAHDEMVVALERICQLLLLDEIHHLHPRLGDYLGSALEHFLTIDRTLIDFLQAEAAREQEA